MKTFKFLSLFAGLLLGALAFVACDKSDDDNNKNGNTNVTVNDILGSWYVTEQTDSKVEVDVILFNANGTGSFTEIKAKANNNWQKVSNTAPFTYTLTGNHVKMVSNVNGSQKVREGDITLNSDGTASVIPYEDGKPGTPMLMRQLGNKTGDEILNELLNGGGGNDNSIQSKIIGTWETNPVDGVKQRWEITKTSVKQMSTYYTYDEYENKSLVGAGVSGYYEIGYSEETGYFLNCHWVYLLDCTNPQAFTFVQGEETHRENPPIGWPFTYDAQNDILRFDAVKDPFYRK